MNQIHADDAAAALYHLIEQELPAGIYNVSDDKPLTQLGFYQWLAEYLGEALPPHGPEPVERKRGVTDKRVSNTKLRSMGWSPIYPSFQEAVMRDAALLAAVRAGGIGDGRS
jgi:nucleoside-diphosphate-sugar epimerase